MQQQQHLASDSVAASESSIYPGAHLALALLTLAMFLNYLDRFLLAVMVQPIKEELHLSDSQIGLLTGFAFSIFYAGVGLPLARLADRGSRRNILACAVVVWSTMTALCGMAQNLPQLLLARLGVGAGESGCLPIAHSLIGDLYPRERRAFALAVFTAGGSAGMLGGFALGGALQAEVGWRMTFVLIGLPGLLLAACCKFFLIEPSRRNDVAAAHLVPERGVRALLNDSTFRHYAVAESLLIFILYGKAQWLPAFYERSFGLARAEIGPLVASTQGLGTVAGMVLGGLICDRLARRRKSWPIEQVILALVASIPLNLLVLTTSNASWALGGSLLAGFVGSLGTGPALSVLQSIVPARLRATASATVMFAVAIFGMGGGPALVGLVSDLFSASFGQQSLRWAMLAVTMPASLWAFAHCIAIRRRIAARN